MAFPNISNEIWMNIFEEFNENFPHRLSELRLVSHMFNDLIIPIRYRNIRLTGSWMYAPQSLLHEIIEDRFTAYSQHVTFRWGRRDLFSRYVNLQNLLERCKRLQSITWIHVYCVNRPHEREQVRLPDDVKAFILGHPHIHLSVADLDYSQVASLASLQICRENVRSVQAFAKSGQSDRNLRMVLSHGTSLENLELDIGRRYRFFMGTGQRLPSSIKRFTLKASHWSLHAEEARHIFDFPALEEFSLAARTPLDEALQLFEHVPAYRLKILRYVSLASPWVPPHLRKQLGAQLSAALAKLPKLQILEIKSSMNRVYLPAMFDQLSELRELDIGLQFAFQNKAVGSPILSQEDIQCVQRLQCIEVLAVDLERDTCDADAFIASLCSIPTLRSLTIRTQTVAHGEYSPCPNILDWMGRAAKNGDSSERDTDRRLATLMVQSAHKHRQHRLAEFKIKLGGYDEKIDWEERVVKVVNGELERRMFVASWNLWSSASKNEVLLEEHRGRKVIESETIQF